MSVTEIKQAIGSWTLTLKPETPQQVLDALTFFGHIALLPGTVDPAQYGDNLLGAARYVGVYRNRDASNRFVLKGSGMAFWLGDEEDKGDVYETLIDINAQTFPNTIRALLPPGGAITEGTLYSVAGTYTGKHQWITPRSAITYVTDLFGAEWRVNNTGTLDAGPLSSLYVTTPKALVLRRGFGADLVRRAIPGSMSMAVDVEDVTTRLVLLAEGEGTSIATAAANAPATPYKDIHGNVIKMTRLVSESSTAEGNAVARAQVQLNRFLNARRAVDLSTSEYDVKGTFVVGDYLDVYDPESGFFDANREIYWQGEHINPMALRCVEMTWPIPPGWTVAFRDINGVWIDLTPYYVGEEGDTSIVVGELTRGLSASTGEPIGVRPNLPDASTPLPDSTIPATPDFTAFSTGSYESDDHTLSAIYMQWAQPLNSDGSTITDGDHYEIRYRPNQVIGTSTPWDYLSGNYDTDVDMLFTPTVSGAWGGGPWNFIWGAPTDFNSGTGIANTIHSTTNVPRGQTYTAVYPDAEVIVNFRIPVNPTGASIVEGVIFRRDTATGTFYHCSVEPNTDLSVTTKLRKWNGSAWEELVTQRIAGMVHDPAVDYWVRVNFVSSGVLSAKIWQGIEDDQPERDTWTYIDTNPLTGGATARVGMYGYLVSGNTNALPVTVSNTTFKIRSLVPDNVANAYSWDDLGTWDALTTEPVTATPNWTISYIGWDQTAFTLVGLGPGVQYEMQIRAADQSSNFSPWSTPSDFVNTIGDAIAPSTPAPPEVAASMIAVQLIHNLGKASGGTFNLEQDLHHFNVHASSSPNFYPDASNKVGELLASGAMVRGGIPAVGTFKVNEPGTTWIRVVAVDRTGNPSAPSDAVQSSVTLIDDAHISNLSVSKLTAGTITANTVLAAEMEVGGGGNIKLTEGSLDVFDNLGVKQVEVGNLSDGTYGLAVVGPSNELTKLSDVIYGPAAAQVLPQEFTSSTTFVNLATVGPTVTVNVGSSGRVLLFLTCTLSLESTDHQVGGMMGFQMSGANVQAPQNLLSLVLVSAISTPSSGDDTLIADRRTVTYFLTGLNPGVTTFQAKYKNFNPNGTGTDVSFYDRQLVVFPY